MFQMKENQLQILSYTNKQQSEKMNAFGHSAFNIAHIHPGSSFRRSQQEYAPPAVFSFCCISKAEQEEFKQTLDGIRSEQQREIEIYQENFKKTVPVIGQSEMKVQ
ncbi:Hypothetical_protein [Hexamita inflata]|uniref:Hypothetical_protein n=1 Tax=Hexamita inflata TaxID=28002 RepID=A0AA86UY23_9EUKA|nr:Hypothetical protein HINF_LOCUS40128 [Hexamita inflata]